MQSLAGTSVSKVAHSSGQRCAATYRQWNANAHLFSSAQEGNEGNINRDTSNSILGNEEDVGARHLGRVLGEPALVLRHLTDPLEIYRANSLSITNRENQYSAASHSFHKLILCDSYGEPETA
jgi:hypothetical protein